MVSQPIVLSENNIWRFLQPEEKIGSKNLKQISMLSSKYRQGLKMLNKQAIHMVFSDCFLLHICVFLYSFYR